MHFAQVGFWASLGKNVLRKIGYTMHWTKSDTTLGKIEYDFGQHASRNLARLWATCCTKSDTTLGWDAQRIEALA